MATPLKFLLYEIAVTNAARLAAFARAAHAGDRSHTPVVLREDFSGTGALARAWVALRETHSGVAVDRDVRVTRHIPPTHRLRVVTADVRDCRSRADVIAATNFAVGYFHDRPSLCTYLRHAHRCVRDGGVFFCDIYGGAGVWIAGTQRVRVHVPADHQKTGARVVIPRSFTYEWQQITADPLTGMVQNAIHFSWREGNRTRRINSAFTYHWRLWSIPELRDAMHEAGFRESQVYTRLADAIDHEGNVHIAPAEPEDVRGDYVAYVVARK